MVANIKVSINKIDIPTPSDQPNLPEIPIQDVFIAGAFAGFLARLLTAPFDLIKIRIQLQSTSNSQYNSVFGVFRKVVHEEGIAALWKGNLSATYLWISYSMVQFSVYATLKKFGDEILSSYHSASYHDRNDIDKSTRHKSFWMSKTVILFCAGAGAGIAATIGTYPFDIMRTQFVIQGNERVFPSMSSFVTHTLQHKGIKGFYVGLAPAIIGITPYMGLNFAFYESFKSVLLRPLQQLTMSSSGNSSMTGILGNILSNGLSGAFAGGASKLIVYPLDTVKKRLQAQSLQVTFTGVNAVKYSGTIDCARKILQSDGILGFYKGIIPTTLKSVASTAVTFAAFEGTKDFLAWRRKNEYR